MLAAAAVGHLALVGLDGFLLRAETRDPALRVPTRPGSRGPLTTYAHLPFERFTNDAIAALPPKSS